MTGTQNLLRNGSRDHDRACSSGIVRNLKVNAFTTFQDSLAVTKTFHIACLCAKFDDPIVSVVPEIYVWLGPPKFKILHVTLGCFVIGRLRLVIINLCIKYEVSIFTRSIQRYERQRKMLEIASGHSGSSLMTLIETICLFRAVFWMQQVIYQNLSTLTSPTCIWRSRWEWLRSNFTTYNLSIPTTRTRHSEALWLQTAEQLLYSLPCNFCFGLHSDPFQYYPKKNLTCKSISSKFSSNYANKH